MPMGGNGTFVVDQHQLEGGVGLVRVEGELDLASAPDLKWALADVLRSGACQLVVDLSEVTFIDSTALGVLVGARRNLRAGARMAIAGTAPTVLNIIELTGLDSTFELFATVEEAIASMRGSEAAAG
jgi:anti-sigma B factor antagonist